MSYIHLNLRVELRARIMLPGEGLTHAVSCELRGRSDLHFRVARQRHLVVDQ